MAKAVCFERDGIQFELRSKFYVAPMYQYADQPPSAVDIALALSGSPELLSEVMRELETIERQSKWKKKP